MPLFQILKEYKVENEPFYQKYRHACVTWYRKRHIALMDGVAFSTPMPPKDWNETVEQTKTQLLKTSQTVGAHLHVFGAQVKEQTSSATVVLQEKTQFLKQKLVEKKVGEKLAGFFKKKKAEVPEEEAKVP
mmetsp:Transcript_4712/g.8047  ORF Transcript_4712/g.8047 Transcript_4712/m.8047 type:complete len:131 (+) Transcript_4712:422-814(+)